ncbi:phage tail tape measure protein [Mycobacteroides abscessus]|uniref:phage tail tape measure protein n=3 Tax=Mycobacteroides abscessus TaxID=36809 RepID=UPI00036D9B8D|nr:phage tail tape measure protein [Mycobacteroides abscessus]MDO3208689.1 phage tail tape measure protein [Mycobacteroides abscessus subsp. massiliense]SKR74270.1 TP901 family phage tail tape measure protein [Mycobacteroides abscessus subsp. massiliense]SKS38865.1 TP901 family phage tail tape measure protein [Mycobacteroides abscessus subsp. massiliense]SKS90955.1 TP901 family phage tail tape measure protein [Mycobacteroides abscessus subsp. massiliense]SKT24898.1 TP901 family phage tail tape
MPVILPIEARPDNQSFKRAADQAVRIFANAGGESSNAFARQFTAGSKAVQSATRTYEKAYDSIADAAGKAKTAESQLQQQRDKAASLGEKIAADEKRLADARKSGDTAAIAAAEKSLTQARDQQARTNTQIVRTAENLNRSRREEVRGIKDAVSAYRELQAAQQSRGPGVISGITSQSSGIVGQLSSIGSAAGKGFVAGAAAAIVAGGLIQVGVKAAEMVLSGFKSVMDTGIDFSRSVNNFKGVTESTDTQTRQMATAARALGADTTLAGVSASDAARAMTELAKAGFSVDQAIGAARGTMQLATAAQVDAGQAAEIQANAMNAFGLKAGDAAHIADVLANAANGSSADIAGIGLSLAQVGGVAAGFGQSIEETATAIAMLANMGIKGSDAGTSLKTMLIQLRNPSDQSAQAMDELGLKVNDANGQLVSMRELFRQLGEAKNRMPTDIFQQNLATLFGTDAIRAPLLGTVSAFDQLYATVNRVGTAGQMAKTQMEGWPGVVEGVKNSAEALQLSLYDVFNTPAGQNLGNKIVSGLSGVVEWVNTHKPEIIGFVTEFASAMATGTDAFLGFTARILQAGGYLADALGVVFGNIGKAIGGVVQAIGSVSKHIPGMKATGEAMETAGGAVLKWSNVMTSAGTNMRSAADGIDHLRDGIRGMRDSFTDSMRETQAQEEMYRRNGQAIESLKGKIEELPDKPKDFVIKDNSDEVKNKLKALGLEAKQLPDGRMVVHIEYRDQNSPTVLSPTQQLGATGSALDAFGSPLGGVLAALGSLPPVPRVGVSNTPMKPKKGGGDSNAYVDPSQFQVGGNPSFATPGVPGVALGPAGPVDAQQVFDAESSLLRAKNNLEQDRLKVIQLEQKGNADQLELLRAKNQVQEDERAYTSAQMKLAEAQRGTVKKMKGFADEMGEIGAKLDADFGASKGLGGFAENLVKFVANLAFAPMLGQLSAIAAANPSKGGYGMMGILGAQGAFGPQFTGIAQDSSYAASGIGPAVIRPGAFSSDAALLANVPAGRYEQTQAADLTKGLGDCSSAVEDLVNIMDGRPTGGRSMATGNAAEWLTAHGFMPGMGGLGDFRVGYNSGHMQATLPGGTPFNWGSDASAANRGIGGTGADDPAFTSHYYRPMGSGAGMTVPSPPAPAYAPLAGNALTNPGLTNPAPAPNPFMGMGGTGGPTGPAQGLSPSGQQYGGVTPASGSGKGGVGMTPGGTLDTAIGMAASGLDLLAPGAGQAAQTGIKLANRAIQYGGQVAGIGVQGLMDTFLPTGGSELANKSWITKIVGGIAGAAPALPNMAGKSTAPQSQNQEDPNAPKNQGGNTTNITVNNNRATEDGTGRDIAYHQQAQNQAPGM